MALLLLKRRANHKFVLLGGFLDFLLFVCIYFQFKELIHRWPFKSSPTVPLRKVRQCLILFMTDSVDVFLNVGIAIAVHVAIGI